MQVRADLEAAVRKSAGRGRHSLVAGVGVDGERRFSAFGLSGDVPGHDSIFEIGSITKALTGTLLADMSMRGEVGLSDPISRHLPASTLPAWSGPVPTLLDLATHRGGLPNAPRPLALRELAFVAGLRSGDPWAEVDPDEYRSMLRAIRPRRRCRMRYSSVGFGLLGDALVAAAGRPYGALLHARITGPLGLSSTSLDGEAIAGFSRRGSPRPPLRDLMGAAGGIRSSAADMLTLLEAAATPPDGDPGPALRLATEQQAGAAGNHRMGLGWMLMRRPRRPEVVWHNGGTFGFRSFAAAIPDRRAAVIVLANTTKSVDRLGFELVEALD